MICICSCQELPSNIPLIVIVAGVDSVEDSAEVEGGVRMEVAMEVMMEELPEEASEAAVRVAVEAEDSEEGKAGAVVVKAGAGEVTAEPLRARAKLKSVLESCCQQTTIVHLSPSHFYQKFVTLRRL